MNNTQLTEFRTFEPEKTVIFSKAEVGSVGNAASKITFKRIRLSARNADGTIGDLVLNTAADLMSFGLQQNMDMTTGKPSGYSFPICLWSRNGATADEKLFVTQFDRLVETCKNYLVEHREELEKYDLEIADLKKFNPLYWKMDKGKIVEDRGPMLYVKVMENKKTEQISTLFIDDQTNQIMDPLDLLEKRCFVTAAIKVESIFIGNKISLQVKLSEAVVKVVDTTIRGLLRPVVVRPEDVANATGTTTSDTASTTPETTTSTTLTNALPEMPPNDDNEVAPEDEDDDVTQEEEEEDDDDLQLPPTIAPSPAPAPIVAAPTQTIAAPVTAAAPPAPAKRGGGGRGKAKTTTPALPVGEVKV